MLYATTARKRSKRLSTLPAPTARALTGRQAVIVFEGAYHGRTNLTTAITSKYALFKKGFITSMITPPTTGRR